MPGTGDIREKAKDGATWAANLVRSTFVQDLGIAALLLLVSLLFFWRVPLEGMAIVTTDGPQFTDLDRQWNLPEFYGSHIDHTWQFDSFPWGACISVAILCVVCVVAACTVIGKGRDWQRRRARDGGEG